MELPQPYIVRYTAYSPREAANLLHIINIEDTIVLPPVKPKAGDVFIYASVSQTILAHRPLKRILLSTPPPPLLLTDFFQNVLVLVIE